MNLLFITKYLAGDIPGIFKELNIVAVACIMVFVAMAIDLCFGIRNARIRGVARTSYGFRRTITKFLQYYSTLLMAFTLDVIASISDHINLPYITFLMAAYLIFIEARSVRENVFDKDGIKQQNKDFQLLAKLLANKGDVVKSLIDAVQKLEEKEDKDDENDK